MSLDVTLYSEVPVVKTGTGIFVRKDGATVELSYDEAKDLYPNHNVQLQQFSTNQLWSGNITHNLVKMAQAVGVYHHLWRPSEIGITNAEQLVEPLKDALSELLVNRKKYEVFNDSNGWGTYDQFLNFIFAYIKACTLYPTAKIGVDI